MQCNGGRGRTTNHLERLRRAARRWEVKRAAFEPRDCSVSRQEIGRLNTTTKRSNGLRRRDAERATEPLIGHSNRHVPRWCNRRPLEPLIGRARRRPRRVVVAVARAAGVGGMRRRRRDRARRRLAVVGLRAVTVVVVAVRKARNARRQRCVIVDRDASYRASRACR